MPNQDNRALEIKVDQDGFYRGFNKFVALSSKLVIAAIVIWAATNPEGAGKILNDMKNWSFENLNYYYNWAVGFFILVCLLVAAYPKWGRLKLGQEGGKPEDCKPEFSNFSWFSMMFGAGIGIGMLGFATGEPITYMDDNPAIRVSTQEIGSYNAPVLKKLGFTMRPFLAYRQKRPFLAYMQKSLFIPGCVQGAII